MSWRDERHHFRPFQQIRSLPSCSSICFRLRRDGEEMWPMVDFRRFLSSQEFSKGLGFRWKHESVGESCTTSKKQSSPSSRVLRGRALAAPLETARDASEHVRLDDRFLIHLSEPSYVFSIRETRSWKRRVQVQAIDTLRRRSHEFDRNRSPFRHRKAGTSPCPPFVTFECPPSVRDPFLFLFSGEDERNAFVRRCSAPRARRSAPSESESHRGNELYKRGKTHRCDGETFGTL